MSCFIWNVKYCSVSQKLNLRSCGRKSPSNRPSWKNWRQFMNFSAVQPHLPLLGAQFFRHPPDKSSLSSPPDGLSPPKRPLCIVEGNQLRYPEDSVIHLSKDWAQTGFHSLSQSIHFGDNNNNNNNSNTLFRFKRTILQTLTKHS